MCGIAGIVDYAQPAAASRPALERMQAALRHRGPDGQGLWVGARAALAHTRLAIQAAAENTQPRVSPDGRYVLVYNGQIYNHRDLAHSLSREYPFETEADSEVVLAALALDGAAALPHLNGMFALFFWDDARREGLLARDLLGVKPLWYERAGGQLRFVSEAGALLAARADAPRLHLPSFVEWVVAPALSGVEHGLFEGIEALAPGHLLRVSESGVRVERWGQFVPHRSERPTGLLLDELPRHVWVAINRAADCDAPTGVFLSGGFDSTLVAGASNFSRDELPAYTIRFEGQAGFDYGESAMTGEDDCPFAKLAAEDLELEHTFVDVPRAGLAGDLERLAQVNSALPCWEQELAQHHLAKAASAKMKAVLVGDAADETHFGYHFLLDGTASASPRAFLDRLGASERVALLHPDLARELRPLEALPNEYRDIAEVDGRRWGSAPEGLDATSLLIVRRWLPRLLHNGDIHTMAFGLEARVPFADTELLTLAEKIAPAVALRDGKEKWHLRQALGDRMPESIRWRKKSALPKDRGAESVYRREALALVGNADPFVSRHLHLAEVKRLAELPGRLSDIQRSILFQAIVFGHFARHHHLR